MSKFKKKIVVIEAVQFWPEKKPWPEGVEESISLLDGERCHVIPVQNTDNGIHILERGDYIVTTPDGERVTMNKDSFEQTYEPAEESR